MITLLAIWTFVKAYWKPLIIGLVVLLTLIFIYRACNRPPKLDEKQIQKAQQAIAENDRKAMEEVLVESEVAEKQIDDKLATAKAEKTNAIIEAKQKAATMTNEELAAELERRAKEGQ